MRLKSQLQIYLSHLRWSASELARKAGVPKQSISYWLGGGTPRKLVHLKKVASALGTTVDHLCFGQGLALHAERSGLEAFETLLPDDWTSAVFEVKVRRIKK